MIAKILITLCFDCGEFNLSKRCSKARTFCKELDKSWMLPNFADDKGFPTFPERKVG